MFVDGTGDGVATGLGDSVRVQLSCRFAVITPVISNIFGGSVRVSAESDFPVKTGLSSIVVTSPPGGGGPVAPVAAFAANLVISPSTISGTTPFVVEFRDTSGGAPTAWNWDFDDGTVSTQQDPLNHTFTTTDPTHTFHVKLTASNAAGSSSSTMDVVVIGASTVDFSASQTVVEHGPGDHVHRRLDARRHGLRLGLRRRRHGHRSDGHPRLRLDQPAARTP